MNKKNAIGIVFICLVILMTTLGCEAKDKDGEPVSSVETVLVILGNEPLDQETPSVDMIARVMKSVEFKKANPDTQLIFTGGPTTGGVSEARMMADIAIAQGIPSDSILLEEKARTTSENAFFAAEMVRRLEPKRIFIVTKSEHIEWAMPIFKKIEVFKDAQILVCEVSRQQSIAQMEEYLKEHDNPRVAKRLQQLQAGIKGVD